MDNTEYVEEFAARIVRRAGVRVAEAYEGDDLRALAHLQRTLDLAVQVAVVGMKEKGHSWQVIGDELGITRQAAQMRFGRYTLTGDTPTGLRVVVSQ